MKKEPQQLKEFEVIGKAIPKFTVNPLDYIKATSQEKKDIDSNEDMLQKIKQATVQFQMTELVKTLLQEQIKNSLYTQPMQPSMYPNGGNVDGYMLPEVEIKAKRINTKYKPAIDKNGGTTPSEPTSNANLIPFIQWLALLAADTATDQIPGNIVTNAKAGFDMYKGHPITSALNYAKIPATPPFDALINILQNNPSGYDTEHLDDYIKKQFRKKASPNKVSNNYAQGGEVIEERDDITDEELKELLAQGYDVEIDGVMHYAKGGVVNDPQKFAGGGKANPFELVETPEGNIPFYLLSPEEQDKLYNNSTEDDHVYIAPMLPPVTITGKKPAPQATISEYKPKSIGRKVWESLVAPVSAMDRFTDTTYDNPNALDNALSIINPFSWIDGSINLAKSSKDLVTGNGNIGDVIDVGLTASLAAAGIRGKKLKGVGKTTKAILNDMFNPLAGLVGTTPIPYEAKTIEQAEKAMSEYNKAAGTTFDEDQLKDYMIDYNNNNNDYLFEPFTNIGIPITSSSQLDGTLPGGDNEQIQLYNRLAAMFEVMPSADKRKLFPNLPTGGQRLMREIERIAEMDVKEAGKKVYATVTEPITDIITGNKQSFKGVKSKTARSLYGSNYVTKYDLIKDPKISKAEKAKIKKMSPEELENSYLSPKMKLVPDELGTQQADVKPMMRNEYVDRFNSNLDRLNEIIAANNTSGRDYRVTGLDEFGNLKFADADGTSSFGTDITPGEFADELQEVADFVYYRNVPGLSMANTVNSVFSDKKKRRGSKAYESINTYLKEMNLGRVKAGFNSQTISSLGLWSDYVKKNKAVGYHPSKDLVYAVMRGLLPATVLTNEFYKAQNQDGKNKNN